MTKDQEIHELREKVKTLSERFEDQRKDFVNYTDLVFKFVERQKLGLDPVEDDEYIQNSVEQLLDNHNVKKEIVSKVYKGRLASVKQMNNGTIHIFQYSYHLDKSDKDYRPIRLSLSPETFYLLLETMMFAEKRFGLDKQAHINNLSESGSIDFKEIFTML